MALNIQKLLDLAKFLRNLGGLIDLEALVALVKAIVPLPASDADVPAWLARIGIAPPLAPVATAILAKILPDSVPALAITRAARGALPLAQSSVAFEFVALPALPTLAAAINPIAQEIREAHPDGIDDAALTAYGDALTVQAVPAWVIPVVLEVLKLLAEWWKNRQ